MKKVKVYSTSINVLLSHLNYGNHLGNDSVLTVLQEARMRWLLSINPGCSEIAIEGNVGWMVRQATVEYLSQAYYDNELLINISVSDCTRSTFLLSYDVGMMCQHLPGHIFN
ncbi:MAG: acyl-CoA thioesterase [Coxiellaceae bacterium]|nr:acyl-CoA thioesterase [Coxiellaceae bacterium]